MNQFRSGFSMLIEQFIDYRKASGSWTESGYGRNIRYFDSFCADSFLPGAALSQVMVDTWCAKRATENNHSNLTRTCVIRAFVGYLRDRGLTAVSAPAALRPEPKTYIPYAFESDELRKFFHECDSIQPCHRSPASLIRKFTIPVFFRLLYSTGMRTTEARLLKAGNVDFAHGVIDIRESKGHDQHYVVMHDTMRNLMARYNQEISRLQPSRKYFFQSIRGSHYSTGWVVQNFRTLWDMANGTAASPVAYELRHHYATENINSWIDDGFEFSDRLQYLSKSMGHRSIEATSGYYSIVPRLADTLKERTEEGFNAVVPEVAGYEEE